MRSLFCVLALTLVFVAKPAKAILYTVNFTLNGFATGSGSFSFDGSVIPIGGGTVGGLLDPIDRSLASSVTFSQPGFPDTQTWDSSNSGVGYLVFDASGNLTQWQMGGDPDGIGNDPISSSVQDFRIQSLSTLESLTASYAGVGTFFTEDILSSDLLTWSITSSPGSAPEPTSWALLGVGLLGIVHVRRRRQRHY